MTLRKLWPCALFAAVCLACTFAPQASEPGYEYALVGGLSAPMMAGALSAVVAFLTRSGSAATAAKRASVYAAIMMLVPLLRVVGRKPCDLWGGSLWVLCGPALGVWLASLIGTRLGRDAKTSTRAVLLGVSAPLASIVLGLLRFVGTPSVHAYDPFVGYFAGTLYDTVIPVDMRYAASRLVSVVMVVLLLATSTRWRGLTAACLLLLLTLEPQFGWFHPSARSLAKTLPLAAAADGCELHGDGEIPAERFAALLRQCEVDKQDVEQYFGVERQSVVVFVFKDAAQKQRLMGAGNTYIAKPWRAEVYVQDAGFPHPTLRHEIAHVVTAAFGAGPLRLGASWHGLLPDPGRIEGFATAADGEAEARRGRVADMMAAGVMPSLSEVFSLAFLAAPSSRSYTVAGCFVDYVHDHYGVSVLRDWYAGGDLPALTRVPYAELEQRFRASLPPPDSAHVQEAKARYGGPGILSRRCPHRIDALRADAARCLAAGDHQGARKLLGAALELAPGDIYLGFEDTRASGPSDPQSKDQLRKLIADQSIDPALRSAALELLADWQVKAALSAEAGEWYRAAALLTSSSDRKRLLELKRLAVVPNAARSLRKRFGMADTGAQTGTPEDESWKSYFEVKDALNRGSLSGICELLLTLPTHPQGFPESAALELSRMRELAKRYVGAPCISLPRAEH